MTYYHHVRRDIQPLLPKNATQILDLGAGAGRTLKWLKTIYPAAQTTGVELNCKLQNELEQNTDLAIIGNVDQCLAQLGTFDLVLMLDVLEHVPDATHTLQRIQKLLKKEGTIIVSLPNVAHLSVSLPLLFRRRFTYQDSGILDRTHIRFFVEETSIQLLNDASFVVTDGLISGLQGFRSKLLDYCSFGLLRHHLAKQYIMVGEPRDGKPVQPQVKWRIAE